MGMRMKKVWMELQGTMCIPSPKASERRPISPMKRSSNEAGPLGAVRQQPCRGSDWSPSSA